MEEISLRELIEVLLKGKWIIAIVTLFFVLVSAVASFFFITPTYQAQAMLMISPIANVSSEDKDDNRFFDLVESLSQYPQMTIDTYREQIKAPVILDAVRTEMKMENETLTSIAEKFSVNAIPNTNLITISVKDKNPNTAAVMANLISNKFTDFVSETNQKQAENSAEFIKTQQEKEKVNMDSALNELKDFLSQPRGPEELKQELDSKLQQLTQFKTQVVEVRIDEQATRTTLENAKKILMKTPETFVLDKSLANDELLSGIFKEKTGLTTENVAGLKLSSEEINEIFIELSKKLNDLEIQLSTLTAQRENMQTEITVRQKEIEVLQAEYTEKQQKLDVLNHNVELVKQTYDAYQQKYKEAMIKQSAEVGKSSIIVVSEAITPRKPVEPNKQLNILAALVLGLILSTFVVFIKKYWSNSSKASVSG